MRLGEICESFWLIESLDSKFDTITWTIHPDRVCGDGSIGDIAIRITLTPYNVGSFSVINIIFAVWDGLLWNEQVGSLTTGQASTIMGAITNAVWDKLAEYEWDAVSLVSKDAVERRSTLYRRIAERISREHGVMPMFSITKNTAHATVVCNNSMSKEDINKLKSLIQ